MRHSMRHDLFRPKPHAWKVVGRIDHNVIELTAIWPQCHWTWKQVAYCVWCHDCSQAYVLLIKITALSPTPLSQYAKAPALVARPGDWRWTEQGNNGARASNVWGITHHEHVKSTVIKLELWTILDFSTGDRNTEQIYCILKQIFTVLEMSDISQYQEEEVTLTTSVIDRKLQFTIELKAKFAKEVKHNYSSCTSTNEGKLKERFRAVCKRR